MAVMEETCYTVPYSPVDTRDKNEYKKPYFQLPGGGALMGCHSGHDMVITIKTNNL